MIRLSAGRCPRPVTGIIDSQSVKAAETVGKDTRGYDAGKKINGRKRHVLVDMFGLPIAVLATPADIRDGDAAQVLLVDCRQDNPQLAMIWATAPTAATSSNGPRTSSGSPSRPSGPYPTKSDSRSTRDAGGSSGHFPGSPSAGANARDYERRADYSAAHILWAFVLVMSRRLTRPRRRPTA